MDNPRLERTALVVDDDAFVLSALAELLTEDGFDVHTASNGFSAARLAIECRPAVILLDVKLPERSGGDLLAELRDQSATHDIAIVIVSANTDLLTDADLARADAVISKPFDLDELLLVVHKEVERAAARRSEVPPVAATSHRQARSVRRTKGARRTRR